jgi:alpha-L-fucosidase 2
MIRYSKIHALSSIMALIVVVILILPPGQTLAQDDDSHDTVTTLWYEQPAKQWVEALPVGNGRLGAMVFGNLREERIQLNEETVWTSGPRRPKSLHGPGALPEIRRLVFAGEYEKAQKLFGERIKPEPMWYARFQPLGDLWIEFPYFKYAEDYRRELNMDTGIVRVTYRVGGIRYTREVFASAVDQVVVVRLEAEQGNRNPEAPGRVSFAARLSGVSGQVPEEEQFRDGYFMETVEVDDTLLLQGRVSSAYGVKGQVEYRAQVKALAEGGSVVVLDKQIIVKNADAVTLLIPMATNFVNYKDVSADPKERIRSCLEALEGKSYEQLRRDHIADHQRLFRRVAMTMDTTENSDLPTDVRIKRFAKGERDPQLAALVFQFGRYLLIASSRPGTQPANLQGIWNQDQSPSWDSKWTTNINAEMNYWPAEVANLSECAEPLFEFIRDLSESGAHTAKDFYGVGGWMLGFNTDLWRNTSPIGNGMFGVWPTGGAWLTTHLWEHYLYTEDKAFLEAYYPVMKGAARFFLDTLVEHPEKKWLVTCPSSSPENDFKIWDPPRPWTFDTPVICAGPTMDMQILRYLFAACAEASERLGVDEDFREELSDAAGRLAPNQIGQYGQLQEWLDDWDHPEDRHRHFSHLWGMFPGAEISVEDTPDLAKAVAKSLQLRGEGGTGFGQAWQVCIWARMRNPRTAHRLFRNLIRDNTNVNLFSRCYDALQVEGSLGITAGIAEMLLQSHDSTIHLLPALPEQWSNGSVRGLCARGGFVVDMAWKGGSLDEVTIHSGLGNPCTVRHGDTTVTLDTTRGESISLDGKLQQHNHG